jgi:hypothetical protein
MAAGRALGNKYEVAEEEFRRSVGHFSTSPLETDGDPGDVAEV